MYIWICAHNVCMSVYIAIYFEWIDLHISTHSMILLANQYDETAPLLRARNCQELAAVCETSTGLGLHS